MSEEEKILYCGEEINVGLIRRQLESYRNSDDIPYYSPSELEVEIKKEILSRKREIGRLTGNRYKKNQGYRLAFYLKERQVFPEAFETKVSDAGARIIVSKLLQHFHNLKLGRPEKYEPIGRVWLRFWGNSQSGNASRRRIRLSHNPSIGIICHEVAHIRIQKHNKKLMRLIKKMVNYCKKKNYWKEEITRRTIPKFCDTEDLNFVVNEFFAKTGWDDILFGGDCWDFAYAFNKLLGWKGKFWHYSGVHGIVEYGGYFWDAHGRQTREDIKVQLNLPQGYKWCRMTKKQVMAETNFNKKNAEKIYLELKK